MEENFEITQEAQDYNNGDLEDSKNEIQLDDTPEFHGLCKARDAFWDPYFKVDGGLAITDTFDLWKTIMPVFAEITRLDYFR